MSFNVRFTPKFMLSAAAAAMVAVGAFSSCNREQKESQDYVQQQIEMVKNDLDQQIKDLDLRLLVNSFFSDSSKNARYQRNLENVKTIAAEYLYGKSDVPKDSLSTNSLMNKIENEYKRNSKDFILPKLWAKLFEAQHNCDSHNESKLLHDLDSLKTKRAAIDKINAQPHSLTEAMGELLFILQEDNDSSSK